MDIFRENQIIMRKLLTLLLLSCCLNYYGQYTPKKHKKDPKQISTKLLTLGGGMIFISAGTISMRKILRQDQELSSNGLMFT